MICSAVSVWGPPIDTSDSVMRGDGNTCARAAPILTGRSSADAVCDSMVVRSISGLSSFRTASASPAPIRAG